jgi:hypothetical protein
MKKGKFFLGMLIVLSFELACTLYGQTRIKLFEESAKYKDRKYYNMAGAEMYLILRGDTLFVPKIGKETFEIPIEYSQRMSTLSDSSLFVCFKTRDFVFMSAVEKAYFLGSSDKNEIRDQFDFSFYRREGEGEDNTMTLYNSYIRQPSISRIVATKEESKFLE